MIIQFNSIYSNNEYLVDSSNIILTNISVIRSTYEVIILGYNDNKPIEISKETYEEIKHNLLPLN